MINLELMKKRLIYEGGNQEARMIKDKYKTFSKALLYSYQRAFVKKIGEDEETRIALINPDKNSTSYDDKMISIDYAFNYTTGDIFEWIGTNTYWLIYLRELTEDAYFRGAIRKCNHQLFWIDMEEEISERKKTSYAYIRGPIETTIDTSTGEGIIMDSPNYSLEIYLPNNKDTKKYFKRYQKFAFNEQVWEIQAVDNISLKDILIIQAKESYENPLLDDSKKEKVTDAFYIAPIIKENNNENIIIGDQFIKPTGTYKYILSKEIDTLNGKWYILEKNYPLTLKIINEKEIYITWNLMKSGQFTLVYENENQKYERVIIVESLF